MAWPGKYADFMTFSINWTAVSCIVALLLGLWNVFYSLWSEKKRVKKETTGKAMDIALELWALSIQYKVSQDKNTIVEIGSRISSLSLALGIYGYRINPHTLMSDTSNGEDIDKEMKSVISTIYKDLRETKN